MQQPSVGRVVHYVSHGTPVRDDGTQAYASQCRAAIITDVPKFLEGDWHGCPNGTSGQWAVSLAVLNPTGLFFDQDLPYDPTGSAGTWHWPERTPEAPTPDPGGWRERYGRIGAAPATEEAPPADS